MSQTTITATSLKVQEELREKYTMIDNTVIDEIWKAAYWRGGADKIAAVINSVRTNIKILTIETVVLYLQNNFTSINKRKVTK